MAWRTRLVSSDALAIGTETRQRCLRTAQLGAAVLLDNEEQRDTNGGPTLELGDETRRLRHDDERGRAPTPGRGFAPVAAMQSPWTATSTTWTSLKSSGSNGDNSEEGVRRLPGEQEAERLTEVVRVLYVPPRHGGLQPLKSG